MYMFILYKMFLISDEKKSERITQVKKPNVTTLLVELDGLFSTRITMQLVPMCRLGLNILLTPRWHICQVGCVYMQPPPNNKDLPHG